MHKVRARVEEIRSQYESLKDKELPVDVITFAELDLGLVPILVPGLSHRFRIDAAIGFDFESLYVDEDQYLALDDRRPWIGKRFRFSVAHELGHYFLHQHLAPQPATYSEAAYIAWCRRPNSDVFTPEQEANEFGGALLVPVDRLDSMVTQTLTAYYDETDRNGDPPPSLRDEFCGHAADKFQVNPQVISARLDREGLWPAT